MKRVSIFLIAVALIAGMMGCGPTLDPSPPPGTPLTYALNISSTAGGSVTATVNEEDTVIGPGETVTTYDIPAGTKVDLLASHDEGYEFVEWVGKPIDGVTTPAVTINVQGYYEITANFELIPSEQFGLTISSTAGGSVTDPGEPGPYTYDEGEEVNLVAEAEEGYRFVNWTGDVDTIADDDDATTTITMNGDYEITANFEPIPSEQFDLTISSTAGGSVFNPGEDTFTYDAGKVVNLVAEAEEGYRFVNWTGDVDTIADDDDATTTITMNGDYFITANFEEEPSDGGCFIATAAYGTPMAEEIEILREFRDEYLLTNPVGRALVALYYRVSPPMAEFIAEHPSLKPIVRTGLVPAVVISTVVINTSPAEKMAIVGLLVLVPVVVAVWVTRRWGRGLQYT